MLLGVGLALSPRPAVGPPAAHSARDVPERIVAADEPAPTELDLTGTWLLRHTVTRSARTDYRGLVLLFRVDLVQSGSRVTGTAVKWRENGRRVPPSARSRLEIEGTLRGDEIVGRFVEIHRGRRSGGTFRWRYSVEEGWLNGTFTTSIASARGDATVIAIG